MYFPMDITGISADTHYWDGAAIVPRPAQVAQWNKTTITADGTDQLILTGLDPAKSVVEVTAPGGTVYLPTIEANGECVLTFSAPGSYTIRSETFPNAPLTQIITVVAP